MELTENRELFGADTLESIVAVEFDGVATAQLFLRSADGSTRTEACPFRPYLWTAEARAGDEPLEGSHPLRALRFFNDWKTLQADRSAARSSSAPTFALGDPVQQYLTLTGRTLFKGLIFENLRRLQIRVIASDPSRPESAALSGVALSDSSGWKTVIADADEKTTIEKVTALVCERDPDIIEGHGLFKFDLPCLVARAKKHKLRLKWGRDGSPLAARSSRLQIAEKTIQYTRFSAHGRHLVDTFVLAQYYDVGTRTLENFELESVASHFNIPAFTDAPGAAQAIGALSAILSASYFIQAQIFPYNYQDVIVRGNATKIDALFLREYLRQRHSLPDLPEARWFEGGYTNIFFTGVAENVWHCDVASLYPSVILQFEYLPANDTLGVFAGMLRDLRVFRLEAKRRMRDASGETGHRHASALQNTFKILINSFYGYLGFAQGHFADFDAAAAVTAKGRELLRAMVDWLQVRGATVIEIDTDGIYFQPPAGATAHDLDAGIREILPDGIEVEFDAQYAAMLSYKAKNYALLGHDGSIALTGAALKSRGMEPYLREFLEHMIRHILTGDLTGIGALRARFEREIREHSWPISRLAKTEALQDNPAAYQRKIAASSRNRSAAFELALASGRDYRAGDTISYYITGTKKRVTAYEFAKRTDAWNPAERDENVEYYVAKLDEIHRKFADFAAPPDPQGALGL